MPTEKTRSNTKWLPGFIYLFSALVGLPTSILSGFAALEGEQGNLGALDSLYAIGNLITNQTTSHFLYGLCCLFATAFVLTGLNTKYLLGATQSVLTLVKANIDYFKSTLLRHPLPAEKKISWTENGLFIWCFLTSLIFAELGKETLAFLGKPGELTGFYLNLIVYFSTRFAGARRFFFDAHTHGASNRLFWRHQTFTEKILAQIGYGFAILSAAPIIINFIPECVHGLQMLLHSTLGADPACQNRYAILIGVTATLPTVFFYSVNIKDLPNHLAKAGSLLHLNLKERQYKNAFSIISLTLLAFTASYFTGIGFRLVGTSNITQGYLSWMNPILAHWMPDALFMAGVMMFWSHLQFLANGRVHAPQPTPSKSSLAMILSSDG